MSYIKPLLIVVGLTIPVFGLAADGGSQAAPATAGQAAQIPPPGTPIPALPKLPDVNKSAFKEVTTDMSPLTPEEIKQLHKMVDDAERAAAAPPRFVQKPVSSTVMASLMPGATPPVVRLGSNFVTSVLFVDQAGNPLPVTDIDVGGSDAFSVTWSKGQKTTATNLVKISPKSPYAMGNVSVTLDGVMAPVSLTLVSGQREVDYRVDVRVKGVGAGVRVTSGIPLPEGANPLMVGFLDGVPPEGAKQIGSSSGDVQAWMYKDRFYVRTGYVLLSPAYVTTVKSADGTAVYEIPPTPVIVALAGGSPVQINLSGY